MNNGIIENNELIGKKVKIELKTKFILFGTITDKTSSGVWLKTATEASFLSYDTILTIREDKDGWF